MSSETKKQEKTNYGSVKGEENIAGRRPGHQRVHVVHLMLRMMVSASYIDYDQGPVPNGTASRIYQVQYRQIVDWSNRLSMR